VNPKSDSAAPSGLLARLAKVQKSEDRREARLNARIPEERRRRIYYAMRRAMSDAMDTPGPAGSLKESTEANFAHVYRRYRVAPDDADCIRTEGDTAGWPQPE